MIDDNPNRQATLLVLNRIDLNTATNISDDETGAKTFRRGIVLLCPLVPAVLYLLSAWARAKMTGQSDFWLAACFDTPMTGDMSIAGLTTLVLMALGAVLFLFAMPATLGVLAFRSRSRFRSTASVWSLAVNSLALFVLCLVLRPTAGIDRLSFFIGWLSWSLGLAVVACRTDDAFKELLRLWQQHRRGIVVSCLTVLAGLLMFHTEQFQQCFNGDGVESFELARSLRQNVLPTWEIESIDRFGAVIVNPSLINSYWTMGLQVLLGDHELATRLSYWVYWWGILLVCFGMIYRFGKVTWGTMATMSLSVLLVTLWNTFYVGYNPYMADLANPGVPDAMFTLCLLLSLDALLQKDCAAWIVATIMGSLVLYAGPVMFVLTVAAALVWGPIERRRLLKAAITGATALAAIAGLYFLWGWKHGLLEGWQATLQGEYIVDFFAPYPRLYANGIFTGYFLLGCGGLPAAAAARALFRSNWERTVATIVLCYLAIVLCSASKNLHYLVPLLPPTVMLWCVAQTSDQRRRSWQTSLIAISSMAVCLTLCWPRARPVFTLNRDLGALTTFDTDRYQEACRWSDVVLLYDLDVASWPASNHVWVAYSSLNSNPEERRPILLTTQSAPPGYRLRAGSETSGLKLYLDTTKTDWLRWTSSRRPETGLERFPYVFQPIAVRPRPKLDL